MSSSGNSSGPVSGSKRCGRMSTVSLSSHSWLPKSMKKKVHTMLVLRVFKMFIINVLKMLALKVFKMLALRVF